jgi:thioredoxin-like negative regulator of GroEL
MSYVPEPGPRIEQRTLCIEDRSHPARTAPLANNATDPAEATRRALEARMKGYEYQSEFAKKYVAQGRVEEAARALLTVLRTRSIAVPEAARERILAQKDPERLERWLEKAAVAPSIAEVLDDPS